MLSVKNLYKTFNIGQENENHVFTDFSLDIEAGKCTALIGSNGCGKSTLMNIIGGSIMAEAGQVILEDIHMEKLTEEERAPYIGRVYQDPSKGVAPSLTILENMSLSDKKGQKFGMKKLVQRDRIPYFVELLKTLDLGLENHLESRVKDLSGGQRQSLSLLMATMNKPKLLLLDEHTAALDPKTSYVVMDRTMDLISTGHITTLMITHDMRDAVEYADRVIMLDAGEIVLDVQSTDISADDLEKVYRDRIKESLSM